MSRCSSSSFLELIENEIAGLRPIEHGLCPRWRPGRAGLVPKPVQLRDQIDEVFEHVESIVDEVGGADRSAVVTLLGSLEAEPNAVWSDPGTLEERLTEQPTARQLLNSRPALGDEPDSPCERSRELGDSVERASAGRRGERSFLAAAEK